MTKAASRKIAYTGFSALYEQPLPEPPPDRAAQLERENQQLKDELRHIHAALEIAARVLHPYYRRLNGRQP